MTMSALANLDWPSNVRKHWQTIQNASLKLAPRTNCQDTPHHATVKQINKSSTYSKVLIGQTYTCYQHQKAHELIPNKHLQAPKADNHRKRAIFNVCYFISI